MNYREDPDMPFEVKLGSMIDYVRYGAHYDEDVEKYVRQVSVGGWPEPQKAAELFVREGGKESEGRLLDIACGTGYVGEAVFEATGRKVWGLDIHEDRLAVCREKRGHAHEQIIQADMAATTTLPENHFEWITCVGAPEMSEEWLPEIDRLLSPTGKLIVVNCNFPLFGKLARSYRRIGEPDWWEQSFPGGREEGESITWMIVALERRPQ